MFKPTINNLQESTSLLPSFKLSNISQKKNDSALPRLKSVNSSKLNLKKLVINADPSPITSPRNVLYDGSSSLSTNRFQPIQSAHLSPREKSTSKILKTEPDRSVTLERINKTVNLTIKDFGQIGLSPRSGQEDPRSPLSLRSPRRLLAITTPREIDSVSLDESKILASNFSKFNNYLASLKKLESRKSPLAKETFYYPEQLEMNKRFKRIEGEMKSVDEKGLFHFRTIREGKKEKIRLPIGTKTYMRLDCVGKTFPLHVRVETKLGTFQIFVSRTQERPERLDCDYYFSQAHFEIDYPNPDKVKALYFHVLGTGNMELSITMNFSEMQQESKNSNVAKSQIITSKGTLLTPRYEIFHENMTREEERNLKEIADEIKRERAERFRAQNRDAISSNFSLAAEYPKIKKEQQAEFVTLLKCFQIQKRDFTLYKNREKRAHLMQRKKLRQVCDMMKPDVKKVVRSWKMQKDIETNQQLTVQKSWLVLAALCFIGKEIREKKRVALAWRVITRIKDHAACRIQRMVRNYLSRSIEIKGRKVEDKEEDEGQNEVNQHQDLVMLNMFNAINTAVLQWKQIQRQNAQKVLGSFFRDFSFAAKISKAAKNYSVRVSKIQRKWKQKMNVVNARVDIFLTCWNEYCGLLLSESKAKNKLLAAFGKIKEQQIREKGKKFVQKRMGSGTMQFIIDAFKTQHNSSKMPTSIIPSLIQDKGPTRTSLRRGSKLGRGSLLHLTRDSISELQNPAESRFIPSLAELKDIFDAIVRDMEAEGQSKEKLVA